MNLMFAKKLIYLLESIDIKTGKLKVDEFTNEEDFEGGMTSIGTLSPNAQVTGGNITNSDSYAPGDNRIPCSIFNRIVKRKRKNTEEDSEENAEEFLNSNSLFRKVKLKDFYNIVKNKQIVFNPLEQDYMLFKNSKQVNEKADLSYKQLLSRGYNWFLSFFRTTNSIFSSLKERSQIILVFDKTGLQNLRSTKLLPFAFYSKEMHKEFESEERLFSKNQTIQINYKNLSDLITGIIVNKYTDEFENLKNICETLEIELMDLNSRTNYLIPQKDVLARTTKSTIDIDKVIPWLENTQLKTIKFKMVYPQIAEFLKQIKAKKLGKQYNPEKLSDLSLEDINTWLDKNIQKGDKDKNIKLHTYLKQVLSL